MHPDPLPEWEVPTILDCDQLIDGIVESGQMLSADQMMTAISRVGRNDAPTFLMAMFIEGCYASLDTLAAGIEGAWTGAEYPLGQLSEDEWGELFNCVGYLHNAARSPRPRSRTSQILYRGCTEGAERGWSWTDDPERARWFANRPILVGKGKLWRAVVSPAQIRARFPDGRGEGEYVLNTSELSIEEIQDQGQDRDELLGIG